LGGGIELPHVAPPWARAVRLAGSTVTSFISERSITIPPSQVPLPAALCPPPRTATGTPCSRPNATATVTSSRLVQGATTAGRLSIMAFHTRLAWS
jgi:hypothetical protein